MIPESDAGPAATPGPCRCDVDPEVFRVYAFAVLAFHRERRAAGGPSWCSCGRKWAACDYARLAEEILFAAPPGPTTARAAPALPAAPGLPGPAGLGYRR